MELLLPVVAATLLCSAAGLGVLLCGWLKKSRKQKRVGLGVFLAPWVMWAMLGIIFPSIDEWNPWIESDAAIIGRWQGDGHEIDLKRDSSFRLSSGGSASTGSWKRDDWNLRLTMDDHSVRLMRFVEDGGDLLLLPDPPEGEMPEPGPIMKRQ